MARLPRLVVPGYPHHLTQRGIKTGTGKLYLIRSACCSKGVCGKGACNWKKRSKIKEHIAAIISSSPVEHGYNDHVWSVPLIAHDARQKLKITVSNATVNRALNSMGYSYKRPSKKVPAKAPSRMPKNKQSTQ